MFANNSIEVMCLPCHVSQSYDLLAMVGLTVKHSNQELVYRQPQELELEREKE